jgi:hypothetical protein
MYVFTIVSYFYFILGFSGKIFCHINKKFMEFYHLLLNFVEFLMWVDVKGKEIVKFIKKLDSLSIFTHTLYLPLLYPRSSRVEKYYS